MHAGSLKNVEESAGNNVPSPRVDGHDFKEYLRPFWESFLVQIEAVDVEEEVNGERVAEVGHVPHRAGVCGRAGDVGHAIQLRVGCSSPA